MDNIAKAQYDAEYVAWIKGLPMSKRAAQARDHLLEHGSLTTEQLSGMGYEHPPRAIRDLRDAGATVTTSSARNGVGKRIASYTLVPEMSVGRTGRVSIPKKFRDLINEEHGYKCAICAGKFEGRELQCDHRIPFGIAGDSATIDAANFMPLCASDNRSKSWSCERCPNWTERDPEVCGTCFWAFPGNYEHVETRPERRVSITFQGDEVSVFNSLKEAASRRQVSVQNLIKDTVGDIF
ncbi:helix-turn-helix domain-containing protein [Amycolatopsis sp. QT-25]|uniref:HNH endonuclease n=1 Tax=Amycolatopsis sp. QT-25 TaxID=3034022 RepID=UPI0023EAEFA2|nr:HNH endonuclease [Amycolatopsis sp. QT-25]WET78700.1 helix-turn-helix domain-containing protein [Amycolatopsis sp. QT-25]